MSGPPKIEPAVQFNINKLDPLAAPPELVEREIIKETVVDGIAGLTITYGSIRLALYVERQIVGKDGVERVITSRLSMPVEAANIIYQTLKAALDGASAAGVIAALPEVKIL